MGTDVIVALLSMIGTLIGTLGGILAASRLTNHRLEQLEKRVNKHNQVVERTYRLEEQMKSANHRITDLEELHKP
ncbi:MAG TPA: hypothetical protein IAB39_03085 [Candidatus Onthovicinus excrementipullorum]|nr:hypothetical protein [Candidatus Onthovicinus excrementipullorum]